MSGSSCLFVPAVAMVFHIRLPVFYGVLGLVGRLMVNDCRLKTNKIKLEDGDAPRNAQITKQVWGLLFSRLCFLCFSCRV